MLRRNVLDSGWRNILRKVPANAVLYLPALPEGLSQATIPDYSGNGNHGTIAGATWTRLNSGLWVLSYDGIDDVTQITHSASINLTTWTTEFWFNFATLAGEQWVFYKASCYAISFYTSDAGVSTGIYVQVWDDDTAKYIGRRTATTGIITQTNTWKHLRVTYNGGVLTTDIAFYLDDVQVDTANYENAGTFTAPRTNTNNIRMGGEPSLWFSGKLALPTQYNTVVDNGTYPRTRRLLGV